MAFDVLSIGLAGVLVLGTLTGVRVHNASVDDAALIMGMNRIRAAYVAIDPGLAPYFVASWHDDRAGLMRTYTIGAARHMVSHIVGQYQHVHERRERDCRRRTGRAPPTLRTQLQP
jgi:hypothetical protein